MVKAEGAPRRDYQVVQLANRGGNVGSAGLVLGVVVSGVAGQLMAVPAAAFAVERRINGRGIALPESGLGVLRGGDGGGFRRGFLFGCGVCAGSGLGGAPGKGAHHQCCRQQAGTNAFHNHFTSFLYKASSP